MDYLVPVLKLSNPIQLSNVAVVFLKPPRVLKLDSGFGIFIFNISFEALLQSLKYIVGVNMDHK